MDVYTNIRHGANNRDHLAGLQAVRPKDVVIGVGENNDGHPTAQALALYKRVGAAIYRTDLDRTVTVSVQPNGKYAIAVERGPTTPRVAASTPLPYSAHTGCPALPQVRRGPGHRCSSASTGTTRVRTSSRVRACDSSRAAINALARVPQVADRRHLPGTLRARGAGLAVA